MKGGDVTGQDDHSTLRIGVCGAHMRGLPLNAQLTERRATFVGEERTAPEYRMFLLDHPAPPRPGLVRTDDGARIALEIWNMPLAEVGGFLRDIPAPLSLGTIALSDGGTVTGFLCEAYATKEARDITRYGGWRRFLEDSA